MSEHQFKIGLMVYFHPRSRQINPAGQPFQITARLPATEDEPHYQVRSPLYGQEFAASERELRPVQTYRSYRS
jgi:hypothetical protein